MNPQVKVIADFPGNNDFNVGDVLTLERWNEFYWSYTVEDCQGVRNYLLDFLEKYPHIFEIVGKEKKSTLPFPTREEAAYPNEYVCGFLFDKQVQQVVLIWKEKPAWQKGKLNGVGGKIEPGETPYQAMVREFKEETGLQVENWQPLASVSEDHYRVRFFYAVDDKNQFEYAETKESEEVAKLDLDEHLFSNYPHISNLEWLIDLAINLATAPDEKIIAGHIDFTGSRWQQGQQPSPTIGARQ